jgi:DNA (cytosine-5)-methyltransferase 1
VHRSETTPQLIALELFCGIGGFAAATAGTNARVVAALDQSRVALDVYRLNFPGHAVREKNLEQVTRTELLDVGADLWWLSPPCQPYSVRGRRRDLDDPRARSLVHLLERFATLPAARLPCHLAVENVAGFACSRARELLTTLLVERGYQVRERLLCPTELGVPSRRPRYYLTASRRGLMPLRTQPHPTRPLQLYLDPQFDADPPAELLLAPQVLANFGAGLRILDPADLAAYTTCFTAGYGKSLMHAGSYLRCGAGIRRFAPLEVAHLLGFPATFRFPEGVPQRKRWHLLGNSLSVTAVREVLRDLPGLVFPEQGSANVDCSA